MGSVEFDGFVPAWIVKEVRAAPANKPPRQRLPAAKPKENKDEPTMKLETQQAPHSHFSF